jgi:dipeptidyl aminopeptidase/acylaminoacyl peptidase
MNEHEMDQKVTEWLVAGAPSHAPARVLDGALERVDARQLRPGTLGLAGHGDRVRVLRWALLTAVVVAALAGAAVAGAMLLRDSIPSPMPAINGWVAFTETGPTRQDRGALVLVRDGTGDQVLTGPDGSPVLSASCATFSPDGSLLAYVEWPAGRDAGAGRPVIVPIDADGRVSGPRIGLPVLVESACPRWSPDGDALAVVGRGSLAGTPLDGLAVGRPDGSIRAVPGWQRQADIVTALEWSPDGAEVMLTTSDGIWIAPVEAGDARRFAGEAAGETFPAGFKVPGARWSADGRIAFPVQRSPGSLIRIAPADTASPSVDLEGGAVFAWSPDGARIVFVREGDESGGPEVVVGAGDGGAVHVIARPDRWVRALAWAPDGTRVVMALDPGPGQAGELAVVQVDGGGQPSVLTRGPHDLDWITSEDLSWQGMHP